MINETIGFPTNKKELYEEAVLWLEGLFEACPHVVANLANASAILNQLMPDINWVGFYLLKSEPVLKNMYELLSHGKNEHISNEFLKAEAEQEMEETDESEEGVLVLGPFQGKPACIEIKVGKGVCGRAVARNEVILVEDVHEFAGHIACDEASNSEIVLPIHANGMVVAVLDIDSPLIARFDEEDKEGLLEVVRAIEEMLVHSQSCLL